MAEKPRHQAQGQAAELGRSERALQLRESKFEINEQGDLLAPAAWLRSALPPSI